MKFEAYQPPQINILPLRLLMIRGEDEKAFNLLRECLKIFSKVLSVNDCIGEDSKKIKKLNLRSNVEKDTGISCNLDKESGFTKYDQMKDDLIDKIEYEIQQQEYNRMLDKEFIDANFDNRLFQLVKYCLRMNNTDW